MEIREKAMDANAITRAYFDEILIEMRHMDAVTPDTTLTLYGETFRTPIMMAALSHIKGQGGKGDGMVEMAEGARRVLKVDVAVSATGVAGPTGGTPQIPVGTVFLGVSGPKGTRVEECHFAGDRAQVRAQSAARALEMALEALDE